MVLNQGPGFVGSHGTVVLSVQDVFRVCTWGGGLGPEGEQQEPREMAAGRGERAGSRGSRTCAAAALGRVLSLCGTSQSWTPVSGWASGHCRAGEGLGQLRMGRVTRSWDRGAGGGAVLEGWGLQGGREMRVRRRPWESPSPRCRSAEGPWGWRREEGADGDQCQGDTEVLKATRLWWGVPLLWRPLAVAPACCFMTAGHSGLGHFPALTCSQRHHPCPETGPRVARVTMEKSERGPPPGGAQALRGQDREAQPLPEAAGGLAAEAGARAEPGRQRAPQPQQGEARAAAGQDPGAGLQGGAAAPVHTATPSGLQGRSLPGGPRPPCVELGLLATECRPSLVRPKLSSGGHTGMCPGWCWRTPGGGPAKQAPSSPRSRFPWDTLGGSVRRDAGWCGH